jgi:heme/copper-type cytochrome/quinol oxidase subunit 2
MSLTAIFTMAFIILFVLGGFIYFLSIAIRKEKARRDQESS